MRYIIPIWVATLEALLVFGLPSRSNISSISAHPSGLLSRSGFKSQQNTLVCGTIPITKKKYICACYDLDDNTCYRADSKNDDQIVSDDDLIKTSIEKLELTVELCYLPKHAQPVFDKGCCVYNCKKEFRKCGNKCIRKTKECVVESAGSNPHNDRRATAQRETSASTCSAGFTACPIDDISNKFECLNVKKDIESCGGCLRTFGMSMTTIGQDCTSIPNVSDIDCILGQCQINKCAAGFELQENTCVFSQTAHLVQQKYRLH